MVFTDQPSIEPQLVKEQVSRIVKSELFKSSRILSNFLKFVVRETLDGKEKDLKEYVIATEVLKKGEDFDPQLDAIVRIHARRLRKLLEEYYLAKGKQDPVKITIPKGRYIPVFEKLYHSSDRRDQTGGDYDLSLETIPTIAVAPFTCAQDNKKGIAICSTLSHDLSVALSFFEHINVVSIYSQQAHSDTQSKQGHYTTPQGIDYLISGRCMREAGNLKVSVELIQLPKRNILWAETMVIESFEQNEIKGYEAIIKKIVASTCGFLGIIYRTKFEHYIPRDYNTLYAIYWHNRYHRDFSMQGYIDASTAIDKAYSVNPDNALITSFKAEMILNLCTMDDDKDLEYFREGSRLISKALNLDQNSPHAWQVFAWSKLLANDKFAYEKAADKCQSLNPYNTMFLGSLGFGHQCAGIFNKGLDLMLESMALNPNYHWVTNLGMCLHHIHEEKYEEAAYWAQLINRRGYLWDVLPRLACHGLCNQQEAASLLKNDLMDLSPKFHERAPYLVGRFIIDQDLQNKILQGLKLAGIKITT